MSVPGGTVQRMSAPLNEDRPGEVPLRPSTDTAIHVIARLIFPDREEWRPGSTCRWTEDQVLVRWWHDDGHEDLAWLPMDDVRRGIVVER